MGQEQSEVSTGLSGAPAAGATLIHRRPWSPLALALATLVTLVGFAANSLLCRAALAEGHADPTSFATLRLVAGAVALLLLTLLQRTPQTGSWTSALALLAYAFLFSLAYVRIEAGVGAFLLFGSVQVTMIGWGWIRGERPLAGEWLGLGLAVAGLALLGLPGARLQDASAAGAMVVAGIAWGVYSLRGRASRSPLGLTAGNFWRAALLALVLAAASTAERRISTTGVALAVVSGAITSALVYALWYALLPHHTATRAALVQLAVPVIAAGASILLLGERLTPRFAGAGGLVLGGVLLALASRRRRATGG